MKKWDVFVFGDINIDLLIPGVSSLPPAGEEWEVPRMRTEPGGGALLFALGLAKLGMKPVFLGSVGEDIYGDYLKSSMEKAGVDLSLLETRPGARTGISISFTDDKDRCFLTYRGGCRVPDIGEVSLEQVSCARHIHLTGYAEAQNHDAYFAFLQRLRRETDVTVSFDVGWDSSGEWSRRIYELFPYLDVLLMNETECMHYSGKSTAREAALDFAENGCLAAIKLGKKGALCCRDGQIFVREGFSVPVVDTTGAGDSFNAGFVYGFLTGADPETALDLGNGCGALSCTGLGGNVMFPTLEGLQDFLKSGRA